MGSSRNRIRKKHNIRTRTKAQKNTTRRLLDLNPGKEKSPIHDDETMDNQRIFVDIDSIQEVIRKSKPFKNTATSSQQISMNSDW